jgi:hypothetical protein
MHHEVTCDLWETLDRMYKELDAQPYNHKPVNILDRPWQEGRRNNARSNEPHSPGSDGLPSGAMEEIREEMAELFWDRLGVSVAEST